MSTHTADTVKHVTILTLQAMRERGQRIAMLTAYDYPSARAVDRAGVDVILVGDSLAMVVLGHQDTLAVTMDEMLHHCRAVKRGAERAMLIGDMPFMSYQVDVPDAVRNAGRFLKEGGMDAVKLEGGRRVIDKVLAIVAAGIPVQGHIGLTPQAVHALGGWRVQGRTAEDAQALMDDAMALEAAGCFSIVLESVPAEVAEAVTARLRVPTIGIGAGVGCSGQVLVLHDLLGIFDRFVPKFVRRYAELDPLIVAAVSEYASDVREGRFPGPEHSYSMDASEWTAFVEQLGEPAGTNQAPPVTAGAPAPP